MKRRGNAFSRRSNLVPNERTDLSWSTIREYVACGFRPELEVALHDAKRHLVQFSRVQGVRAGEEDDGTSWSLGGAIRELEKRGHIDGFEAERLQAAVAIRNDLVHGGEVPNDAVLIRAVNAIAE